ncbi:hypothetical protein DFH09DRAFT_1363817 [Mycena vulgaris]|nr:hypothetical protein DFH09DRAFT_1363817 [Mycena vulgaris]
MPLHDLNSDVLLCIFVLTDVATILSLSKVNKIFHEVASTKQLWILIIRGLASRGLVDPPLDDVLENMTTPALIDEVNRVVVGPRTWSPGSLDPPTVSRETTIPHGGMGMGGELLPGGRYILFYCGPWVNGRWVECWEVYTGRRVWSYTQAGFCVWYAVFDFRGASKAVVALVMDSPEGRARQLILEVDLQTGGSRKLLGLCNELKNPHGLELSADCFVFEAGEWGYRFVLLANWRTGEYLIFRVNNYQRFTLALFPGHIIVAKTPREVDGWETTDCIHLCCIASLGGIWKPLSEIDTTGWADTTGILGVIWPLAIDTFRVEELSVTESPLHDEIYQLRVRGIRKNDTLELRYHFTLSSETLSSPLLPQPTVTHLPPRPIRGRRWISRAGYSMYSTSTVVGSASAMMVYTPSADGAPGAREKLRQVPIKDADGLEQLNLTHSGAVLALYQSRVVVSYYV